VEVCSEKAGEDYDKLKIFECPTYYHIKEDKLDHLAKKSVFKFQERCESLQAVGILKTRRLW